ncbi:hypothetical protein [Microlunatus soli]|uniref:DUF4149 domain-containing protein n=1 Tax=Microlunatus soli TaxID=630515 RepID=A0A1H1T3V4_9ACTN|nr:hypothetical protein [Microlunatus soli]SDS54917.1 hypothetical protein SAMN04489812_2243 [Microlunatus soli]
MNSSTTLRVACSCLTLAVIAGIAESAVAVITFLLTTGLPPGWQLQIGVRLAVYATAFVLIALTWRGYRATRWILLILLGVLGTASMVVPMVAEVATGHSMLEALGGDTSPLFPFLRVAHIALVVTGSIALLTYRPADTEERTPVVVH